MFSFNTDKYICSLHVKVITTNPLPMYRALYLKYLELYKIVLLHIVAAAAAVNKQKIDMRIKNIYNHPDCLELSVHYC